MLRIDARGEVLLASVAELAHESRAGTGVDLVRALGLAGLSLSELTRPERAAFALGLLSGVPHGTVASGQLRAALLHG